MAVSWKKHIGRKRINSNRNIHTTSKNVARRRIRKKDILFIQSNEMKSPITIEDNNIERLQNDETKEAYNKVDSIHLQDVQNTLKVLKKAKKKMKKHATKSNDDNRGNLMKKCFQNRELSWLKFNERVLEEAADATIPLCERMTFLSIFQSNLDEFFMVRVGSLHDMMVVNNEVRDNKTNMTPAEQIEAVLQEVARLKKRFEKIYEEIMSLAKEEGFRFVKPNQLSKEDISYMQQYFEREILPLLSVMIVGKKQPFPFLKNNDIYVIAPLTGKERNGDNKIRREKLGIIPCTSGVFDRMIPVPNRPEAFILAEELILYFTPKVFKRYHVQSKALIRITRNADIDAESIADEDLNYREHMEEVIRLRRKLGPVRMEMTSEMDVHTIDFICQNIGLTKDRIFISKMPLDLSFVFFIQDMLRKNSKLFYDKLVPQNSIEVQKDKPMLEQIRKKDILLTYPFETIKPFLNMLHEAANDPEVVSIKMTLYRLAKHSKVIEALVEAAENGKQVDVLVELKARFDEENNIEWSRRLEDAGCHVIYGVDKLKVHSKLCLITKKSGGKIEYFTQIGTGNYNEKTSRLYTDLSIMTSNPDIGMEALSVFHALSLGEVVEKTKHLLVAPKCMQNKILSFIEDEIEIAKNGGDGYIGVKLNSLTDKKIIDKLIEASQAGVKIEMVIRGICCLQTGVTGYTDNIQVSSIVGRYLEHSRIYIFGKGERERMYISSADFMTRNMVRRVEVAAPIYDESIKKRLHVLFDMLLHDNVKARVQMPDGLYRKKEQMGELLNSQEQCFQDAIEKSQDSE